MSKFRLFYSEDEFKKLRNANADIAEIYHICGKPRDTCAPRPGSLGGAAFGYWYANAVLDAESRRRRLRTENIQNAADRTRVYRHSGTYRK